MIETTAPWLVLYTVLGYFVIWGIYSILFVGWRKGETAEALISAGCAAWNAPAIRAWANTYGCRIQMQDPKT
jgi:hypothetical protein